jgi:TetR/AcrR family transcriptional repressor of nem operon
MKRNTKQLLLEKGLEILMVRGYNNTGIQEVLEGVGVPKGSFYHYFGSKHAFGLGVLELYCERAMEHARAILEDPSRQPLERLQGFFEDAHRRMVESKLSGGCLIGNMSQEMGDQCHEFQRILEQKWAAMRNSLEACLKEARQKGQLATDVDSDVLADFLINSWQGALIRMKVAKTDRPLEIFMQTVFEHLVSPASV